MYGRGCGGALQLQRWGEGCFFWACNAWPDCQYREYPPPRATTPELAITVDRRRQALEVGPAVGAEDAVQACGGVVAVLRAAGADLSRSLPAAPAAAPAPSVPPGPTACQQADAAQAAAPAPAEQPTVDAQPGTMHGTAAGPAGEPQPPDGRQQAAADASGLQQPEQAQEQQQEPALPPQEQAGQEGPQAQQQQQEEPAQQPPNPALLQPVVFPLAEYERLSSKLQLFSRQSGVAVLSTAGRIPEPTLKAARWEAAGRQHGQRLDAWQHWL